MPVRIQRPASRRLDEIVRHTQERWGLDQASRYVEGLFDTFAKIEAGSIRSRRIPPAFEVDGYVLRYRRHVIYWRRLPNGDVAIVTILHERMHQLDRFRRDRSDGDETPD